MFFFTFEFHAHLPEIVFRKENSHKEAQTTQETEMNFLCFLCLFVAVPLMLQCRAHWSRLSSINPPDSSVQKRSIDMKTLLVISVTLLSLTLPARSQAQERVRQVQVGGTPLLPDNLVNGPVPRLADGKPDLTGPWM